MTGYSAEDAIALFEAIGALEGADAERVAAGPAEDLLAHLEALHAEMRSHDDAGLLDACFAPHNATHDTVVDGRRNALPAESRRQAMHEHEALMMGMRRRDPAKAGDLWRAAADQGGGVHCRSPKNTHLCSPSTAFEGTDLPQRTAITSIGEMAFEDCKAIGVRNLAHARAASPQRRRHAAPTGQTW